MLLTPIYKNDQHYIFTAEAADLATVEFILSFDDPMLTGEAVACANFTPIADELLEGPEIFEIQLAGEDVFQDDLQVTILDSGIKTKWSCHTLALLHASIEI